MEANQRVAQALTFGAYRARNWENLSPDGPMRTPALWMPDVAGAYARDVIIGVLTGKAGNAAWKAESLWGTAGYAALFGLGTGYNIGQSVNGIQDGIKTFRGGGYFWGSLQILGGSVGILGEAAALRGFGAARYADDLRVPKAAECANPAKACFIAGTLVMTREGLKPIEEITEGDVIISFDEAAGEFVESRVTRTFERSYNGQMVTVQLAVGTLQCTDEHPFWVVSGDGLSGRPALFAAESSGDVESANGRWVAARDLQAGDHLLSVRGEELEVIRVSACTSHDVAVYNFEVEGTHAYAVSTAGLVVHNQCGSPAPKEVPIGSTRHVEMPDAENGAYFGMLKNGKAYVGKGPPSRARQSLRRKSLEQGSPVDDIAYYPTADDAAAFLKEADLIEDLGGVDAPDLLNKRNSPGRAR